MPLGHEEALTRVSSTTGADYYATAGHMLLVGLPHVPSSPMRAHIDDLGGVKPPLGLKCCLSLTLDGRLGLIDIPNPEDALGWLTLSARSGRIRSRKSSGR